MKKNRFWTILIILAMIAAGALYFLQSPGILFNKLGEKNKVIVVGAGISGLTSALELAQKGVDVTLIEKEDKVGGRLCSDYIDGVACNLGAQWVNAGLSPIVDPYITCFPLQQIGNKDGGMAITWKGKMITVKGDDFLKSLPFSKKAKKDFIASAIQMEKDARALYPGIDFGKEKSWQYIYDLPTNTPLWKKLEKMTISQYLKKYDPVVTTVWGTRVSGGFGGSPDTISALFLIGWYRGSPFFPMTIIKGGNHRLAEAMAQEIAKLKGKIILNCEVTEIAQDGKKVKVRCGNGKEYTSDYCIITTPAAVARKIVKGLPQKKYEALSAVQYVPLVAAAMHVKNFPSGDKLSGVLFVKENTAAFISQTGPVAGYPKVGTIILACITKKEKTGLSDKKTLEIICEDLKIVSPRFSPKKDLLAYKIKQWKYGEVHMSPGFLSKYGDRLKEPVGRIYFAGEYASNFPTWGGGVWAGDKAVMGVLKAMKKN